ncbi:MAG: IS630 family transposase [Chroococcidiopsidaceae cyanobacterium CP_BM_RX_35]|nr:IS630 family transposase [Chroococcidiopsidaceae cyanobacterium CP_BM_RX_35]
MSIDLELLKSYYSNQLAAEKPKSVRYWCQDESRFDLLTIPGRKITATGVKPVGKVQWESERYYLYGLVEPKSGENFFWEFSHMDSACFQVYLREFAHAYPEDLHIIQLDNGALHKAKKLQVLPNILLLFQPAHSPELNPIERLWEHFKGQLKWQVFKDLKHLQERVSELLRNLGQEVIASLTGWTYILEALFVVGI